MGDLLVANRGKASFRFSERITMKTNQSVAAAPKLDSEASAESEGKRERRSSQDVAGAKVAETFRSQAELQLRIEDVGCRGIDGSTSRSSSTPSATSSSHTTTDAGSEENSQQSSCSSSMAGIRKTSNSPARATGSKGPQQQRSVFPDVLNLDDEIGVSDAVLLDPVSEDAFIANLLMRFKRDHIYTYIGNVLVSVNPYKPLALYSPSVMEAYRARSMFELPPHIFAIADCAWTNLRNYHTDQVIVVTGESGAGKTEASKLILQYITASSERSQELNQIKHMLLQSNPLLEAFGNAKTYRNDNSSRFGKYMDIAFDYKGEPVGGVITNYLLEKSRVTAQGTSERNFHIFYQLLSGADVTLLKSLKLQRNPENYAFLRTAKPNIPIVQNDKEDFAITKKAMISLGFTADEIQHVFHIIASVLKLGNLGFVPVTNIDGTEGCQIVNDYELEEVCGLLGCPVDSLRTALLYRKVSYDAYLPLSRDSSLPRDTRESHKGTLSHSSSLGREMYEVCDLLRSDVSSLHAALTSRTVEAKTEAVLTDLSASEAVYARDALCKALYSRLFTWFVNQINEKIKVKQTGKKRVLGVLDIYGFEVLETNGFEQFIINYCNEKLQQVFIELTLKEEQEEYVKEGLEWSPVEYFDNASICDLIEKNTGGILSLLDEECLRPGQVSDDTFLHKISQAFHDHQHFESRLYRPNLSDNSLPYEAFRLKHYAGCVNYSTQGFVDKNNDMLFRDLSQAMYRCDLSILKELFPEGNPRRATLRRPATTGSQFKLSVASLMKNLSTKMPHYVRCIKPNEMKQPNIFEMALVQHQVRYLGLMENVRVKRMGFAYRQTYLAFLARYKMLCNVTWPSWEGLPIEGVAVILRHLPVSATEYAFGRSKIFIKNPRTVMELEEYRRQRLESLAVLLQKTFRGWWHRNQFRKMKKAQILIAATWKRYKSRKYFLDTRAKIILLQALYRGRKARQEYDEMLQRRRITWAVSVIEKHYLAWRRRRFMIRLASRLPSASPISKDWPTVSPMLAETSLYLKNLYHKWKCHRYRAQFDQTARNRMREKVTASIIFKHRKESYSKSVSHPFQGDYVRLRQNAQWRRMSADTQDQHVVFADIINKITRSSGKFMPVLLVVSTNAILVMDQRTLHVKYRVPASEVWRISLSPFLDDIALFHVKMSPMCLESTKSLQGGCLFHGAGASETVPTHKGDFVLQTCHIIELVTKVFLVVQNATGKPPEVNISTDSRM